MNTEILHKAANEARGLAIDAIFDKASGHMGLPLGCAELGAALFGEILNINPAEPRWLNRDRFVLSGGHGSMFLYSWLHLSGFELSLDDIKAFRSHGSKTPGHPEFNCAPGVECTTGPLGQGVANAVGFAISAKHAAAKFNTAAHEIFSQNVYCLAGDGCMQEGLSREAAAIAGVLKLDNLVLIYDSNGITLDAPIAVSQIEDIAAIYQAMGWDAVTIDGNNLIEVEKTLRVASLEKNGRPKLIIAKTIIAKGVPGFEGTTKGHGEGGGKLWKEAHANWGIPEELYYVSDEVRAYMAELKNQRADAYQAWLADFQAWELSNPALAKELTDSCELSTTGISAEVSTATIPLFATASKLATRSSGSIVQNALGAANPGLLSTSADLFSSNKNYLQGAGDFSADNYSGRNFWFGIREHAMGAICNGIAYDGIFRVSAGTFCVFVDYMRASIRVAALAHLPVTYVLTHDSVAVGEDGPTHQPIETVSGLRLIPNLDVVRPADEEEAAGAWMCAMQRVNGPTALIFTRQDIPSLNGITGTCVSAEQRRQGTLQGAYIVRKESTEQPELIIIATGSEVCLALEAAEQLGAGVRVVSMPSMWRFEREDEAYRQSVLPCSCKRRIAIEAGRADLWFRYVHNSKAIISIDEFGFSAPGDQVLRDMGMNVENIIKVAQSI